jgi:hypothetical protein
MQVLHFGGARKGRGEGKHDISLIYFLVRFGSDLGGPKNSILGRFSHCFGFGPKSNVMRGPIITRQQHVHRGKIILFIPKFLFFFF